MKIMDKEKDRKTQTVKHNSVKNEYLYMFRGGQYCNTSLKYFHNYF